MIVSKITEYTIFESPDGGETIYARLPGQTDRILIKESDHVQQVRHDTEEIQLWEAIRQESKKNTTLREAMNRVILLYHLAKETND